MKRRQEIERCAICGCRLNRGGEYGDPSHASGHHYVARRFFKKKKDDPIFKNCPWTLEKPIEIFCFDCHEQLLHNPVLLREDIERFRKLVELKGLSQSEKEPSRDKIAGRIKLLHKVIAAGLEALLVAEKRK